MAASYELAWRFPGGSAASLPADASTGCIPDEAATLLKEVAAAHPRIAPADNNVIQQLHQAAHGERPMCINVCSAVSAYLRSQHAADGANGRTLTAWLQQHGCKPTLLHNRGDSSVAGISAAAAENDAAREAWRSEMKSRAAHREYAGIVSDLTSSETLQSEASAFRQLTQQMQIGLSALFALLSAVAVGFYLGRQLHGAGSTQEWLYALIAGVVLLIVEMLLLISRLARVDAVEARTRVAQTQKPLPQAR